MHCALYVFYEANKDDYYKVIILITHAIHNKVYRDILLQQDLGHYIDRLDV